MKIQKLKISDLKPAEYNPRKKLSPSDEAYKMLKASIENFGYVDPIIVNIRTMTVIGGHQRLEVLKDLKYEEAECVILDLDETTEKKLNISLNKNSGYWDNDKLEQLFDDLKLSSEEMFATGFTEAEVANLKTDFISDLLEEEYSTIDRQLNEFSITFNIPKEYEKDFAEYVKVNSKTPLVDILIKEVKGVERNA